MSQNIVQVNVSQTVPPAPSQLQRTGALISQGGTTKAAQTLTLITQLADLTAISSTAKAITSMVLSTGVVTVTTTAPHGWTNADVIPVVIAGVTPAAYNGNVTATITGASTFTYPLGGSPGSVTVQGTVLLESEVELLSMATTFFAQGSSQSVYVLELGEGNATEGVAALTTWLTANPGRIYSYLVPREWDAVSSYLTLLGNYDSTTSKTYFFTTTTTGTYTSYTALMKACFALVEAPVIPSTEFTCAAPFWKSLSYAPSSTNRVPPIAFSYLFGVTPYPTQGNTAILQSLRTANINVVGTGSEGGISTAILLWGHVLDGNPFNYWYSAYWAQINLEQDLANEVINGSNSTLAPLYYDQNGIDRLQNRASATLGNAITYGLALGTVVTTQLPASVFATNFENGLYAGKLAINAEPFNVYTAENPNDYAIGTYGGLAAVYTPARGFEQIIFNLNLTNFVGG